jgi:hypothetical protein
MKRVWIVVCTCTLALVSAAGFAQTPSVASLTSEALAAILGPSADTASPPCAGGGLRGELLAAKTTYGGGVGSDSICYAEANCASGIVSCNGNSVCSAVDRDCLSCEQGHVTCDGATTWCPTACNCNSYFGTQKWCCLCACNGDCFSCCRCDGGGAGQCAFQCG